MSNLRPPPVPTERRDSFPILTEDDRRLIVNVIDYSKRALEETSARVRSFEDALNHRVENVERQILELRQGVLDLRTVHTDVRDLRSDFQALNKAVLENLRDDRRMEQSLGDFKAEVKAELAVIAHGAGKEAGKEAGQKVAHSTAAKIALAVVSPPSLGFIGWIIYMLISGRAVAPPSPIEADRTKPPQQQHEHEKTPGGEKP